jgi:hypothetical protein
MNWLEHAPLLLIGVVIAVALIVAHEVAHWLGRLVAGKAPGSEARGYLVSSALGLLALLMAFTFSAAQDRFSVRQDLLVKEANAIGSSYLQVQLLDPPWRDDLSRELLRYAQVRARFQDVETPGEIEAISRQTAALQDGIWRTLAGAVRANPVPTLNPVLVEAVDESFDFAASNRAARETRLPVAILRLLVLASLAIAAIVGYTEAFDRRDTGVVASVLLMLTIAFCLILDLDRPVSGRVRINEAPIRRAADDISRREAAKAPSAARPSPPAEEGR